VSDCFVGVWWGFHLWYLSSNIAILWAQGGPFLGLESGYQRVEPDRLNATERLLVFLAVVVSFVIS